MMNAWCVLDAAIPRDRARWLDLWETWPDREVMARPDYVSLFARSCDQVCCAILECCDGNVMFPFILRPLSVEPWVVEGGCYDIINPYGYGGPFAWGTPNAEVFWKEFDEWARQIGIVSVFVRLSLFADQVIPFAGDTRISCSNVVRNLDLDSNVLWMDYKHKVRKNVKRALSLGLRVEVDMTGARLDEFVRIYHSTMRRRDAQDQYYFPKDFFLNALNNLSGQLAFFHALHNARIVSTELILVSVSHIYSFLGGTLPEAFALRPNDLIKHSIIEWGRTKGKKAFILGGGYSDCDGIFLYKKSFAPDGEMPFKVGVRVIDSERYRELIIMRQVWESRNGKSWNPKPDYFPEYRA